MRDVILLSIGAAVRATAVLPLVFPRPFAYNTGIPVRR
jgi:hypothetical protein